MRQPTKMPTYTARQMGEARAAWEAGGFSEEWTAWRAMAARAAGIIYPPAGTRWDCWADADPSQRAILIRAIRETPRLLEWAICGAEPSWRSVISRLLAGRDEMREQAILAEPEFERPPDREAMYRLADIIRIIRDSAR